MDIYDINVESFDEGIFAVSLVDEPAVESYWQRFNNQEKKQHQMFSIENEEERIVIGCILRANYLIYRQDDNGYEYYVKFTPETIKIIAEKMLKDGTYQNNDTNHNNVFEDGVQLREVFIKDERKTVVGFDECENGSLFCVYHITNDVIWEAIKSGKYQGFSIEGWFSHNLEKQIQNKSHKNENTKMSIKEKIKEALTKVFAEFGKLVVDQDNSFIFEGDTVEVGTRLYMENGEDVADGEYTVDGKTYVVIDSTVTEIKDVEVVEEEEIIENVENEAVEAVEETETEETVVEEPVVVVEENTEIEDIKKEIADIKAVIEEIKASIEEIAKASASAPIEKELDNMAKQTPKTGNKTIDEKLEKIRNMKK